MSHTNDTTTNSLKRPLEGDDHPDVSAPPRQRQQLEDAVVSSADEPMRESAPSEVVAEAGPSTQIAEPEPSEDQTARRGKGKKLPIPRRVAREARKVLNFRRGTRPEGEEAQTQADDADKGPRLPKRQCALLLGFCGSGYSGMQLCVFCI